MDAYPILHKLHSEKKAFLEDLRPKYILPSLIKYKVITPQEGKEIVSEVTTPSEQVEKLIAILTKKNPLKLKYFIKSLIEDEDGCSTYPWLARKLEMSNNLNDKVNAILVNGNIPFPVNYLMHRHENMEKIREELKNVAESKSRHWIVIFGPIGSGKSVLAAESLRDNHIIENYFPGGVYWIQIGNAEKDEAIWFKIKKLLKLMDYKNELHPNETVHDLNVTLRKEVSKRPKMLLVLDDVWSKEAIKAFDIGCPILVTTKNRGALDKVSSYCSHIECKNDLSIDATSELLARYVNCDPEQLPPIVSDICMKCSGSPLKSSLIGGKMADVGNNAKAWFDLNNRLNERGMGTLGRKRYNSGESETDLSEIINLCLEPIHHYKDYYLDFLIFIKEFSVPNEVLEMLWDKKDYEVQEIMFELHNRCFVQVEKSEEDDNSFSYKGHDLYLDTLKAEIDKSERFFVENQAIDGKLSCTPFMKPLKH